MRPRPRLPMSGQNCHNWTDPNEFKFLTQDLDPSQVAPVRTITTYRLSMEEYDDEDMENSVSSCRRDPSGKRLINKPETKKKFLLTVQPQMVIIDRRPMLKKQEHNSRLAPMDSTEVTTTSLIGPGENCDDSEEDVFQEIDCDN